jgi:hypothetical protein
MYRALDADKIIATIDLLQRRIDERFPALDLAAVAGAAPAEGHLSLSNALICSSSEPVAALSTARGLKMGLSLAVTSWFKAQLGGGATRPPWRPRHLLPATLPNGGKNPEINRWRVIDMHQLTKDPSLVLGTERVKDTAASPKRVMTAFELGRYLDCSEMLSLTGKVAALYAQDLDDPVVVEAVNDIEMLATNLSRKVWQKIAILQAATLGQLQMRALTE